MAAVGCKKPPPPPKEEPPPPLRPSVSLTAELSSIEGGKPVTLNWSSQNATSASINQGVGAVPKSGSREVFPAQSTSYQITAKGADGEALPVRVTVRVPPPPERSITDVFQASNIRDALFD